MCDNYIIFLLLKKYIFLRIKCENPKNERELTKMEFTKEK